MIYWNNSWGENSFRIPLIYWEVFIIIIIIIIIIIKLWYWRTIKEEYNSHGNFYIVNYLTQGNLPLQS